MKKQMIGLLILALFMLLLNCGGGGNSSSSGSYKTNVEIVLQTSRSASVESTTKKENSQIPAGVVTVRFTISAPDMDTIWREVSVVGRTTIVETFEVPAGPNRRFLIEAIDAAGNVKYKGDVYATVGGTPLTLTINTESTDPVGPVFGGLSSIGEVTSNSLLLSWSAASDNITPPSNLQYLIYKSESPGVQTTDTNLCDTIQGATSYQMTGLSPYTTYYFLVRVKDEWGNVDLNSREMFGTTRPAPTNPPTFAGLNSVTPTRTNSVQLSWAAASDDTTLPQNIVYLIYVANTPGGENFSSTPYITPAGATSFTISNFLCTTTPATTYYFVARAQDQDGNIDTNNREVSAGIDCNPPTWPAIERFLQVSWTGGMTVDLIWSAASDDLTPQGNIMYRIYQATSQGAENYSSPIATTPAGVTSYTVTVPTNNTRYYFVVRAVDEAGNEETNTVEEPVCVGTCVSPNPTISNANYSLTQLNDPRCSYNVPPNPLGSSFTVTFNYTDPEGNGPTDISQAHLYIGWHFLYGTDGSWPEGYTWPNSSYTYVNGNGFSGTVTSLQCYFFGSNTYVDVTMTIRDSSGGISNPLTVTINKPNGSN